MVYVRRGMLGPKRFEIKIAVFVPPPTAGIKAVIQSTIPEQGCKMMTLRLALVPLRTVQTASVPGQTAGLHFAGCWAHHLCTAL